MKFAVLWVRFMFLKTSSLKKTLEKDKLYYFEVLPFLKCMR
jgi:hypothetical protein